MNDYFTITNLYSHREYYKPSYGLWYDWFAWYPIRLLTWQWIDTPYYGRYYKLSKWVWLKTIKRRSVIHGPVYSLTKHYEYTTVFDILKFG